MKRLIVVGVMSIIAVISSSAFASTVHFYAPKAEMAAIKGEYVEAARLEMTHTFILSKKANKSNSALYISPNPALNPDIVQIFAAEIAYSRGDYVAAMSISRPLAEKGYVEPGYNIGIMYYKGEGVPQNYNTAFKYIEASAQVIVWSRGQYALASMYLLGQGTQEDTVKAYVWASIAVASSAGLVSTRAQKDEYIRYRDMIAGTLSKGRLENAQEIAQTLYYELYEKSIGATKLSDEEFDRLYGEKAIPGPK